MVRLSCRQNPKKAGAPIRYEYNNTNSPIQTIPNFICPETWSDKGSHTLPHKPTVYLPLDETIRWDAAIPGRSLASTAQSSQPASARGDQAHRRYAPQKPKCGPGGILDQTEAARLQQIHLRLISVFKEKRADG